MGTPAAVAAEAVALVNEWHEQAQAAPPEAPAGRAGEG